MMKKLFKATEYVFRASKMRQKTLSLLLIVIMALSIFPIETLATDSVIWLTENYSWSADEVFKDSLMVVHDVGDREGYVYEDTKYGFIDATGKVVIPLVYDSCGGFAEGLSSVSKGEKYGFIDKTGKVVIPLTYDYCYDFNDGLAKVRKGDYYGGKYGFIDKTGKEIIPLVYNSVSEFKNGIAAVTNENDEIGFIDKSGKLLVQTKYTDYGGNNIQQFNEGLCPVYVYDSEIRGIKYGFIDTTGKLVINTIFSDYGMLMNPYRFNGGVSKVYLEDEEGFVKYIDKTGKIIPEPKQIINGVAVVYKDDMYGAIDETGKLVVPYIYSYIRSFKDGIVIAVKDNKCGVIDKTGKEIVSFVYDNISSINEGVIFVRKDGKVGVIKNLLGDKSVAATVTATQTSSKVIVNGSYVTFEAYGINGNNYFKLRDLAMALKGTNKQFEVTWNGEKNAINLISNKTYTVTGGELVVSKSPSNKMASATTSKIFIDSASVDFTAYTIGGNNYFKLRDVMKVFNVGVTWDGTTNTISIDTSIGYTE